MRLDQFLTMNGFGSRKQVKRLLLQRKVQVDQRIVMDDGFNVEPWIQEVRIGGKVYSRKIHDYILLNKPAGVVSAVSDEQHPTVVDLIDSADQISKESLFPVGRLDRDTTGLVLLTNNGQFAYQMMHPQFHVVKKYLVAVNGLLTGEDSIQFAEGIIFDGGEKCRPAKLEILSASQSESRAVVEISEGKFHQVKKMFLCVGKKVTSLKRIAIGCLELDDQLEVGEYRMVTKDELKGLWEEGLRESSN